MAEIPEEARVAAIEEIGRRITHGTPGSLLVQIVNWSLDAAAPFFKAHYRREALEEAVKHFEERAKTSLAPRLYLAAANEIRALKEKPNG